MMTNTKACRGRRRWSAWAGVLSVAAIALGVASTPTAHADEGMWLFNDPPATELQEQYGFIVTPEWLLRLMRASVRVEDGGSASFVSPDGLVLTNHHVALGQINKLSTPERDLVTDGFVARTRAEELRCPDAVLLSARRILDVSRRVKEAMDAADPDERDAARRAEIAAIETEAADEYGLWPEVVTLHGGALHHLYLYKKYTDVRLVFAPENRVAAFGGDVDNFNYPRFCLDVALYRAYENGEPAQVEDYLPIDFEGASNGELVFVSGHPGRTQRNYTPEHLEFLRDVRYPLYMQRIWRREVQLRVFAEEGPEQAALAARDLPLFQNARKGLGGKLRVLQNPRVMGEKRARQQLMMADLRVNADAQEVLGDAFGEVARAVDRAAELFERYELLENRTMLGSQLFRIARHIVRLSAERERPAGERLAEYRPSQMPAVEQELYSTAPILDELERNRLESALAELVERFGGGSDVVTRALGSASAEAMARELVAETELADIEARRRLAGQSPDELRRSTDPMIRLALAVDPIARSAREAYEAEVEAPLRDAYARIAQVRERLSTDRRIYPDATFTLRLSIGTIDGFFRDEQWYGAFTRLGGMYDRMASRGAEPPFDLPANWLDARDRLDLETPYNFVSTNDIIGGNSGSPVTDRSGKLVGVIFDGNPESFAWDVIWTQRTARAVSVDIRSMIHALDVVYGADHLLDELRRAAEAAERPTE